MKFSHDGRKRKAVRECCLRGSDWRRGVGSDCGAAPGPVQVHRQRSPSPNRQLTSCILPRSQKAKQHLISWSTPPYDVLTCSHHPVTTVLLRSIVSSLPTRHPFQHHHSLQVPRTKAPHNPVSPRRSKHSQWPPNPKPPSLTPRPSRLFRLALSAATRWRSTSSSAPTRRT